MATVPSPAFTDLAATYQQVLVNDITDCIGGLITAAAYPEGGEERITRRNWAHAIPPPTRAPALCRATGPKIPRSHQYVVPVDGRVAAFARSVRVSERQGGKRMPRSFIAALVLATVLLGFALPASAGDNFVAPLSGDEEVPAVDTQATGVATFKVRQEGLAFKLNVANIDDVLFAHIHCGAVGVNGPIGVTLFMGGPVTVNGTLASGVVTAPDPANACGWADLDAVVTALESGDTYVNVHTTAHTGGEIRGQVK